MQPMHVSWLPYGAVAIIAALTAAHYARTVRYYAPGIPLWILACHSITIAALWLMVHGSIQPFKTSLALFVIGSLLSTLVAKLDRMVREDDLSDAAGWTYNTRSYNPIEGCLAFFFVMGAMVIADVLS